MAKKKTTLPENVADMFFTQADTVSGKESGTENLPPLKEETDHPAVMTTHTKTATITIVPKGKTEFRSRRVQCVFQPSVYDKLKANADENGLSVNDLINQLVIAYLGNE